MVYIKRFISVFCVLVSLATPAWALTIINQDSEIGYFMLFDISECGTDERNPNANVLASGKLLMGQRVNITPTQARVCIVTYGTQHGVYWQSLYHNVAQDNCVATMQLNPVLLSLSSACL